MNKEFDFIDLSKVDLVIDAFYKGGNAGNVGDDPISKLLICGNQGGFRYSGSVENFDLKYVILYTSLDDKDWPDYLDTLTGEFHYYGDNKTPGHLLHETSKKGNTILKESFNRIHSNDRVQIPPFFIFSKGNNGRDVVFRGLAVPGALGLGSDNDLIAIWKTNSGQRFQNYKAIFTILDEALINRTWIDDLNKGIKISENTPKSFLNWLQTGVIKPLRAQPSVKHRKKEEQIPTEKNDLELIKLIYNKFVSNPYLFEKCAVELAKLMDTNIIECDLTRPWVDGGRDAIGKYRIGITENSIEVDFALEAKCYELNNGIGVKLTSRLISRLRHRQFGIFITTSYVSEQAYKEIIEDMHPVIIISALDIIKILKKSDLADLNKLNNWLKQF